MKKSFKIKYLQFMLVALMPPAAIAAEGAPESKRLGSEERKARIEKRMAECRADSEKCRAQRQARYAQWCNANPERCKELQARMEKRLAECKTNPEKCRAEIQARFEQRFKHADADGNGLISREEAEKVMPNFVCRFDAIDVSRDGQISMEEIASARKVRHGERGRRGFERREPNRI